MKIPASFTELLINGTRPTPCTAWSPSSYFHISYCCYGNKSPTSQLHDLSQKRTSQTKPLKLTAVPPVLGLKILCCPWEGTGIIPTLPKTQQLNPSLQLPPGKQCKVPNFNISWLISAKTPNQWKIPGTSVVGLKILGSFWSGHGQPPPKTPLLLLEVPAVIPTSHSCCLTECHSFTTDVGRDANQAKLLKLIGPVLRSWNSWLVIPPNSTILTTQMEHLIFPN